MHLLTLIFGIVLLPKAHTLKCYECLPGFTSGSCTNKEKECPSQTQCLASRVVSYAGESKLVDMSLKTCSLAEDCIGGSINYGAYRTAVTTKCCTTELCNNQPPADPNRSKPNGKKCFTCNNQTCTAALDCEGDEDYCISATDLLTFWCGPSNGQLHNSGHYGRQTPSFSEPDATRENHIILGLEVAGNHHRGLSEGTESERNISIQTVGHCKE